MKTFDQIREELSEQLKPEHKQLMDKHKKAAEEHGGLKRRYSGFYSSAHPKTMAHRDMHDAHDAIAHHINLYHGGGRGGVHPNLHKHLKHLADTVEKHKDHLDQEHVSRARDLHKNMSNVKEDTSDAVKAFLAKGGKIKKLPPAKAQGYHGKDDPGKDMHGVMDRPDTKAIGTRKKAKSMEATKEAKRTVTIDKPDRLTSLRVSKDKPPFDNAKPVNKDPKDKFGNPIKNRAKHLARKAARDLLNKSKNEGTVNELSPDTKKSYTKKATTDLYGRGLRKGMDIERGSSSLGRTKVVDKDNDRKISNRHAGIYRAQK